MTTLRKAYGSYEIAKVCGVSPNTTWRWIRDGKLPSFKTGGGQRRVWNEDLSLFLKDLGIPVPSKLMGAAAGATRVLIVDDEEDVRYTLKRMIRKFWPKAEISEAANGFDAGQKLLDLLPHVMLLDIALPGVDGFEICRTVRAHPKIKNVKILAISGYSVEEWGKKVIEAGADAFLQKPIELETCRQAIQKWMEAPR